MGRRRFVKSLVTMGVSAEAALHLDKEKLENITGDPTEEVPRLGALKRPDAEKYEEPPYPETLSEREPEYYTISHNDWMVAETAFDAARKVQRRIDQLDDSGLISSKVIMQSNNGTEPYHVGVVRSTRIRYDSFDKRTSLSELSETKKETADITVDELQGELPDTVSGVAGEGDYETERDGIELRFSESVEWDESCDDEECDEGTTGVEFFQHPYRYENDDGDITCATGCRIDTDPDGYDGTLSLGPRVKSTFGDPKFLTSAHGVFESDLDDDGEPEEDPQDAIGRTIHQGGILNTDKIGEVDEIKDRRGEESWPWDAALIETYRVGIDEELSAGNRLASDSGTNEFSGALSTAGRIGKDYYKDNMGPTCKQGIRTGRCEHTLWGYDEDPDRPDQIELMRDASDGGGDSGCPYFVDENGDFMVSGLHRAGDRRDPGDGWPPQDLALGIWIGDIEDGFNVEVV
ncbi:hypothetical protein C500_06226 [Natrialba magadii ATCC 43099]|nr:hypothetical protein C500_06226 [Natrialba magadii ATCC 43099]